MKVTFIMPSVGRKNGNSKYVRTWIFEPLPIATLAALTPPDIDREFFDDRCEPINYDTKTDLVALSVETFTARRSYEIAKQFRDRGVKVIMGGFHPTLVTEEVKQYADSVAVGEAENIWEEILDDVKNNQLKKVYESSEKPSLANRFPDRSIFQDRKYLDQYLGLGLIETGRGCKYNCDFCSICKFFKHSYNPRPVEDIVAEIKQLNRRIYLFVEDNISSDIGHLKNLLKALIPLKIKWLSQGGLTLAEDPELLSLMKKSGCLGFLAGFESLNHKNLKSMNKNINIKTGIDRSVKRINDAGLRIFATFVFGYDDDKIDDFENTYEYTLNNKFFMTAFNHIIPFPGTQLYDRFKKEGKLLNDKWWLKHDYTYGKVVFEPKNFTPSQLEELSYEYRKKFYSLKSIVRRFPTKINISNIFSLISYFYVSFNMMVEARSQQGLSMGLGEEI